MRCGGGERQVLAAVFPLGGGGAVCLQLQDEAELRRGGVYLLAEDDPALAALAPRFDELFADAAAKLAAAPSRRPDLLALLEAARTVAQACFPRLTADALGGLADLAQDARRLDAACPAEGLSWEALVVCAALIFVSEEERYPRPKFRGADVALERFLDVLA